MVELAEVKDLNSLKTFSFSFIRNLHIYRDFIQNGDLGELRAFRASFGFPRFLTVRIYVVH